MTEPQHPALLQRLAAGVNAYSEGSLAHRIVHHVWEDVISGALETGERLPTARELAIELGTSPKTVERAYDELERLGVASVRPAEGTFVSLSVPDARVSGRYQRLDAIAREAVHQAETTGLTRYELLDAIRELPAVDSESEL